MRRGLYSLILVLLALSAGARPALLTGLQQGQRNQAVPLTPDSNPPGSNPTTLALARQNTPPPPNAEQPLIFGRRGAFQPHGSPRPCPWRRRFWRARSYRTCRKRCGFGLCPSGSHCSRGPAHTRPAHARRQSGPQLQRSLRHGEWPAQCSFHLPARLFRWPGRYGARLLLPLSRESGSASKSPVIRRNVRGAGFIRGSRFAERGAAPAARAGLVEWDHAQQGSIDLSRKLAAFVQTELIRRFKGSPEMPIAAPVRQLRTIAAPAIAIEISSIDVTDAKRLDQMAQPLAEAIGRAVAEFPSPSPAPASSGGPSGASR